MWRPDLFLLSSQWSVFLGGIVSLFVQAEYGRQISLTPSLEFVTCCLSAHQVLQYLTPAHPPLLCQSVIKTSSANCILAPAFVLSEKKAS